MIQSNKGQRTWRERKKKCRVAYQITFTFGRSHVGWRESLIKTTCYHNQQKLKFYI
jgi:hypothetical protein